MAFSERSLDDYVDVAQRIADFRALYPDGSLRGDWRMEQVGSQALVAYRAEAFRRPHDPAPGVGSAWELVPGRTPFTRGSELQNAETSAWGRAIVAVGASDAKKGIASREEVRNRRTEEPPCPVCGSAWPDCGHRNADGSLSRSRTTDAEKDAAGVMTAAQQAEHSALRAEPCPICHDTYTDLNGHLKTSKKPGHLHGPPLTVVGPPDDPWLDQPAGSLDLNQPIEEKPGTVSAKQQRAIHAACTGMDRAKRLATISDIVGRQVASSNELSYVEAAVVLGKLSGAQA